MHGFRQGKEEYHLVYIGLLRFEFHGGLRLIQVGVGFQINQPVVDLGSEISRFNVLQNRIWMIVSLRFALE